MATRQSEHCDAQTGHARLATTLAIARTDATTQNSSLGPSTGVRDTTSEISSLRDNECIVQGCDVQGSPCRRKEDSSKVVKPCRKPRKALSQMGQFNAAANSKGPSKQPSAGKPRPKAVATSHKSKVWQAHTPPPPAIATTKHLKLTENDEESLCVLVEESQENIKDCRTQRSPPGRVAEMVATHTMNAGNIDSDAVEAGEENELPGQDKIQNTADFQAAAADGCNKAAGVSFNDGGNCDDLHQSFPPSSPGRFAKWNRETVSLLNDELVYCEPSQFSEQRRQDDEKGVTGSISRGRLGAHLPPLLATRITLCPGTDKKDSVTTVPATDYTASNLLLNSTPLLSNTVGPSPPLKLQPLTPSAKERQRLFNVLTDDEEEPVLLTVKSATGIPGAADAPDGWARARSIEGSVLDWEQSDSMPVTGESLNAPALREQSKRGSLGSLGICASVTDSGALLNDFLSAELKVRPTLKEKLKSKSADKHAVASLSDTKKDTENKRRSLPTTPEQDTTALLQHPVSLREESPLPPLRTTSSTSQKRSALLATKQKRTPAETGSDLSDMESTALDAESRDEPTTQPQSISQILALLPNKQQPPATPKSPKRRAVKGKRLKAERKLVMKSDDDAAKTPKPRKRRILAMVNDEGTPLARSSMKKAHRPTKNTNAPLKLDEYAVPPGMTAHDVMSRAASGANDEQRMSAARKASKTSRPTPRPWVQLHETDWDSLPKPPPAKACSKALEKRGNTQTQPVEHTSSRGKRVRMAAESGNGELEVSWPHEVASSIYALTHRGEQDDEQAQRRLARIAEFRAIDATSLHVELI